MAMLESNTIEERILYWLSLDMRVRALAERLLERFAVTVGDLPASAAHHHAEPDGLYRHSVEVALKALEEFEGNMKMERRPDGSVDSFRSSRNRSRWQYATFIAALCHDLGKLFDLEVRGKGQTWCPLHEPYDGFGQRTKSPVASWRPDRQYGAHAWSSLALLHHVVSCEDVAYLGAPRLWHLFASLAEGHSNAHQNHKPKNWRCFMTNEGNGFTQYVVLNEVVLGEACIIEKCNEWISLAFIKLGIGRPDAVSDHAFVENHLLIPKTPN